MATPSVFSLANKSLRLNTAADLEPHISPLRDSPSVTEIHLNGNTLGVPACESLASILSTKHTLQIANLGDIFTSRLLPEIPPALSALLTSLLKLPHLHTIDLSDNAFGLNTVAPLVEFLSKHTPLRHLILNNNGLGPEAGALVANALIDLAKRKEESRAEGKDVPDLETVVCGRNRLENGSMKAWAGAYRAHKGVKSVKMGNNGIRQGGVAALLREGLGGCKSLEVLDLQDNTFTVTGSTALAEVVGGWTALTELGVGDCLLGARGAVKVFEALGEVENAKLQTLRAQYNDIDVSGVSALLRSTKARLTSLRRIELNGNNFAEEESAIEGLRILLEERRVEAGGEEDEWGLALESDVESDEDEDEEEEDKEREEKAEGVLKQADMAEEANVAQKTDADVDELAERLDKTAL